MFFVLILYSVYRTTTIDPNIIYALVSLILGSSVMTLVQRNRNASNISNRNINENITENTNNGVIN